MENFTYETLVDSEGLERTDLILRSDGAFIPLSESNSDYQAYCVWAVAEGLMEAPVVVEPEVVEPEVVAEPDPAP